jgi:hypothetical protein
LTFTFKNAVDTNNTHYTGTAAFSPCCPFPGGVTYLP